MRKIAFRWLGYSLVVAAALTGCSSEAAIAPERGAAIVADAGSGQASRAVDLGTCDSLEVPAGSKLAFHAYAEGVQIYRWNGTGWGSPTPDATLSADPARKSVVGIHYGGPTWESNSGSLVKATVSKRCRPDPNAIPWLLLTATVAKGPGVFDRVAFIQRVNTVGGNEPTTAGAFVGQEARIPYTTEYFFYRAP